jgi:trk system potassium uptake protein TrkH
MITLGTLILLHITDFPTDQVIFEVISAFGTVGLSTGITGDLPAPAQLVIIALMYVGRVGTITFATSLMLVERRAQYSYPEEHPIVG